MRLSHLVLALLTLALLAACSSPESRIASRRGVFDQFPAEVQAKIRAGQVGVGFTTEMVQLALGEPDRKFTRKTEGGDTEVWGYRSSSPRFSLGLGIGTGGRHSAVGGGIAVSSGGYDPEEKIRVEFRAGLVTAVDYLNK